MISLVVHLDMDHLLQFSTHLVSFVDLIFIWFLTKFKFYLFKFYISDGFINTNIELEHHKDHNDRGGVSGACAAMLNGSSYIIGGYLTNRVSDWRQGTMSVNWRPVGWAC